MIIPAVSTAFEVLVQAFHYRHFVAHFVAQFVAQSVWKSKCRGIIRDKYVMISAAYLVCDARKWCPHTDLNRGPPDYKTEYSINTVSYQGVEIRQNLLKSVL